MISATSKGIFWPIQIAIPTSGRNRIVARSMLRSLLRTRIPINMGSARYSSDDVAMPAPVTLVCASSSSSCWPINELAVMSVNATMMYTSANHTKIRNSTNERPLMCWRTTSAIDRPRCRTDATRAEKSWTPPIRIEPHRIQSMAGSQPNKAPARMGPTIGPAAAIAEKCWLRRGLVSSGA
jgi:hypothetical protein